MARITEGRLPCEGITLIQFRDQYLRNKNATEDWFFTRRSPDSVKGGHSIRRASSNVRVEVPSRAGVKAAHVTFA